MNIEDPELDKELKDLLRQDANGGYSDGPFYDIKGRQVEGKYKSLTDVVRKVKEIMARYSTYKEEQS